MAGELPLHIKRHPVLRKIYRDVHRLKLNATIICIGKPGMGKSVIVQKMAKDLDQTFNLNRVVFSLEEFLKLLNKGDPTTGKLKPGQAIVFDEVVTDEGAEARGAMSKSNKLMTYIAANFRARRLIVFMCLPSLMQLDKNLRDVNVTAIIQVLDKDTAKRKNKCKILYCRYDPYTQFPIREYPRLIDKRGLVYKIKTFLLPIPEQEVIDAYEVKKMDYLDRNIARWFEMVDKEKNKKDFDMKKVLANVEENPEKYLDKGKFCSGFIKIHEGIGRINAEIIAKYLNSKLEKENTVEAVAAGLRDLK